MVAANPERGEVELVIGDTTLVLAAEMGRLAALSKKLECKSLKDLYDAMTGLAPHAVEACIQCLAIKGDVDAALGQMRMHHFQAAQEAFNVVLEHHITPEDNKKAQKPGKA